MTVSCLACLMAWKEFFNTHSAPSVLRTFFVIGIVCMFTCVTSHPVPNTTESVYLTVINGTVVNGTLVNGTVVNGTVVNSSNDPDTIHDWTVILVTLFTALMNSKASMLWAESRMLRKLTSPNRGEKEWVASVKQSMPQHQQLNFEMVFAHSVINLSKGRHTLYGRLYNSFYLAFSCVFDLIIIVFDIDILTSDVVVAFRFLIYGGSLAVLGARQFSALEYVLSFGPPALLASLLIAEGFIPQESRLSSLPWAPYVPKVVLYTSICLDFLFGVQEVVYTLLRWDVDMFSITTRILEGKKLTESQKSYIRRIDENPNSLKTENKKYWRVGFRKTFDYISFILAGFSIFFYDISPSQRPYFVVLDTFQMVAATLFTINDTHIAPTLFKELVNRVSRHMPEKATP